MALALFIGPAKAQRTFQCNCQARLARPRVGPSVSRSTAHGETSFVSVGEDCGKRKGNWNLRFWILDLKNTVKCTSNRKSEIAIRKSDNSHAAFFGKKPFNSFAKC